MQNKWKATLLCSIMFAACGDDFSDEVRNIDHTKYICFGTPAVSMEGVDILRSEPLSRSTLINGALPEGGSFGVMGYCVPYTLVTSGGDISVSQEKDYFAGTSKWENKNSLVIPDVFYKQKVTYENGVCRYTPVKPWYTQQQVNNPNIRPENFYYSFFAYYPFDGNFFTVAPGRASDYGAPKITFTMPFENGSVTTSREHGNIPDAMLATQYDYQKAQGSVPFRFYHLLTALRFRINNYDDKRLLTIHSLTFSGQFYRSVTVDFAENPPVQKVAELATSHYRGTFEIVNNTGNPEVCIAGASRLMGVTDENPDGTTLLLLPNPDANPNAVLPSFYLGEEKTVSITYSFENGSPVTQTIENINLAYKPMQSTRYTVNLNFMGGKFVLMCQPDNNEHWEGDNENDIIIQ